MTRPSKRRFCLTMANQMEPAAYIRYVLDHIGEADTQ